MCVCMQVFRMEEGLNGGGRGVGRIKGNVLGFKGGVAVPFEAKEEEAEEDEDPVKDVSREGTLSGFVAPTDDSLEEGPKIIAFRVTAMELP